MKKRTFILLMIALLFCLSTQCQVMLDRQIVATGSGVYNSKAFQGKGNLNARTLEEDSTVVPGRTIYIYGNYENDVLFVEIDSVKYKCLKWINVDNSQDVVTSGDILIIKRVGEKVKYLVYNPVIDGVHTMVLFDQEDKFITYSILPRAPYYEGVDMRND